MIILWIFIAFGFTGAALKMLIGPNRGVGCLWMVLVAAAASLVMYVTVDAGF